jgi:phosphatidylserine decarboxylase
MSANTEPASPAVSNASSSLTHRTVSSLRSIWLQEDLNFLLTNRVPRIALTRFMGWYSAIRSPLLTRLSIAVWRLFTDLDLSEARRTRFDSLQECFTRELVPGARPFDPDEATLASPCDAIVGACGQVRDGQVWQAKGFPYSVADLFGPDQDRSGFEGGTFVTLRLTSAMYHRFHAPHDALIEAVTYHSGDTWNVNPIALQRVQRLFCLNERAVIDMRLARGGHRIALVPVAAILVASIRLHCLDVLLHLRYQGPRHRPLSAPIKRGEEMGWFQHGSTILVFAPPGFELAPGIEPGRRIHAGRALMSLPAEESPA